MCDDPSKLTECSEQKEADETTYTIEELLQRQDAEFAAAQQLEADTQDTINCCQYSNGYIRQTMFACLDCYGNNSAYVCYGCIMNCHVECKNIHEMYEKSYTRCDCGTNVPNTNNVERKPCQFDSDHSKQSAVNSENRYTHNNHARYCYCDTVHDDKREYMSCHLCEDWFHAGPADTCLTFANGQPVPADIDDTDRTLICKLCMNKPYIDVLLPYIVAEIQRNNAAALNTTNDAAITSPAPKRFRSALDPTTPAAEQSPSVAASPNQPIPCTRVRDIPADFDVAPLRQHDLLTSILDRDICQCSDCCELYESLRIKQQLFGVDDVEDDAAELADVTATPNTAANVVAQHTDNVLLQIIARLPVPAAADMILKYNNFKQALTAEFSEYMRVHEPSVITAEIIKHIFEQAKGRAAQVTLAQDSNPELMEYAE